jgi:DNA-binding transcriptional ArsR family regulator
MVYRSSSIYDQTAVREASSMAAPSNTIPDLAGAARVPDPDLELDLEAVARVARALSHPVRLRILQILGGRGTCWCGDLCAEFSLAQSTISQHLKTLREAGLVRATPCGTSVGYCRDEEQLARYIHWVATLAESS